MYLSDLMRGLVDDPDEESKALMELLHHSELIIPAKSKKQMLDLMQVLASRSHSVPLLEQWFVPCEEVSALRASRAQATGTMIARAQYRAYGCNGRTSNPCGLVCCFRNGTALSVAERGDGCTFLGWGGSIVS